MVRGYRRFAPLPVLAAALLILGCATDEEPPLPGKRVAVFPQQQASIAAVDGKITRLPPPQTNASWPQAGGSGTHTMGHLRLNIAPSRAWTANIGHGGGDRNALLGEPIVADGHIFVIDSTARVSAFDANDGTLAWRVALAPPWDRKDALLGGGLAFYEGRLFITTGFAAVIALDAADGAELWRVSLPAPARAAPNVADGRVLTALVNNDVMALDTTNGRIIWTYSATEETTSLLAPASPAVSLGTAIVAFPSGELTAVRADVGAQLWTDTVALAHPVATDNTLKNVSDPVVGGGLVFTLSNAGLLAATSLRTGDRVWDIEFGGLQRPWLAGSYLFATSAHGDVVAVDAREGEIIWRVPLPTNPDNKRSHWSGPILASGRLFVFGSHGQALALSPYTGEIVSTMTIPKGIEPRPVIANNTLYLLTSSGKLAAFR